MNLSPRLTFSLFAGNVAGKKAPIASRFTSFSGQVAKYIYGKMGTPMTLIVRMTTD